MKRRFQLLPDPDGNIFRRRLRQDVVDEGVVQLTYNKFLHEVLEAHEIKNHALMVRRALNFDNKFIRMAVEMFTFSVVIGEKMGGVKIKFL